MVVITYIISSAVVKDNHKNLTQDPYPILLNWADNTTANSWTLKAAATNAAGKALSRIFCAARRGNVLGIIPKHIAGEANNTADAISRTNHTPGNPPDFARLLKLSQLASCQRFQISNTLLSLILEALLHGLAPNVNLPKNIGQFVADSSTT